MPSLSYTNKFCYSGNPERLKYLGLGTPLQQLTTFRGNSNPVAELGSVLRTHGGTLRALRLFFSFWRTQDFGMITEPAPSLQLLGLTQVGHLIEAAIQDILKSKQHLKPLRHVELLSGDFSLQKKPFIGTTPNVYRIQRGFLAFALSTCLTIRQGLIRWY